MPKPIGRRTALLAALLLAMVSPQIAAAEESKTRVTILGVDHAAQLVAEKDQPGTLAAWLDMVKPAALCIERPPEQASRQDFYEFTYEIQGIILPWAAANPATEICPIDWTPPIDDQLLGFGLDLDTPLEIRKAKGFQGFLTFPDPKILGWDFLAGDNPAALAPLQKWAGEPAPRADRDLPRRLYLYRTFMQAQRIRAIARKRRGETVVVVVGYFHKPDIEAILGQDAAIKLIPASRLGRPDDAAVRAATTPQHRGAILAFNLLGMQAATGNANWNWVGHVLADFGSASPEAKLFETRHALLTGKIAPADAARRYQAIAADPAAAHPPTWNGVKDGARIDSFFDPFGNLDVRQRARVELARSLFALGKARQAEAELARLTAELPPRKALQLRGYTPLLRPATKTP